MTGSLRERGANSWELRVYQGTDPTTGRRRYATRTIRGSRTQAQRELVELAAAATKPAAEPTEMRPPTPAQINALLTHAAADPAFHLFLVLAATAGARRGVLLALRWADIDLAQGSASIQRALVDGPTATVQAPTKTRHPHHLDLDARTLTLRAHHDNVHRLASGPVDRGRDRFVVSAKPDGAVPWRPNWVTKRFIAIRTAAGVGSFRLHHLRHFMATEMLNRHVPLPTVSGRLAHARMSTTLNVYAHAVPSGDRPAATLIADFVTGARSPQRPPDPAAARPRAHARRHAPRGPRCRHRPLT